MTYAPASITDAMSYWVGKGGVNLGIVGDAAHQTKSSYHNGLDVIVKNGWQSTDYSYRLPRDRCCATNAASAMDLGKLKNSFTLLRDFSNWLVNEALKDPRGFANDVREIIWSPDGVYVKRWSSPDNKVYTSLHKNSDGSITVITPGNGDATHFSHTHISFYRDSERRDKTPLFRRYFEPEVDVAGIKITLDVTKSGLTLDQRLASVGTGKITGQGHDGINQQTRKIDVLDLPDGFDLGFVQHGVLGEPFVGRPAGHGIYATNLGSPATLYIFMEEDVAFTPLKLPAAPAPDCTDAVNKAVSQANEAWTSWLASAPKG